MLLNMEWSTEDTFCRLHMISILQAPFSHTAVLEIKLELSFYTILPLSVVVALKVSSKQILF